MTPYLQQKTLFAPQIKKKPSLNLGIVVVIPARNEPHILLSLLSLKKCSLPKCDVEVIVVLNDSQNDKLSVKETNRSSFLQLEEWCAGQHHPRIKFHVLYHTDLPQKYAGVGLARKIGMDEAAFRLEKVRNRQGMICGFDADSRVDPNYFLAIEEFFQTHPDCQAVSIHYEHPLEGADFSEEVYKAIVDYELHLRYFIDMQRWIGFPFAFQTIGSSMAVRAETYQKQGGMNRRKAGEDFYFLQKLIELGHFRDLTATRVIPSPRPSDRVPFGTGKAVGQIIQSGEELKTYAPQSFYQLQNLFGQVELVYQRNNISVGPILQEFLNEQGFTAACEEIRNNTSSLDAFTKRFYRWFNAFRLMKYLHFAREMGQPDIPVGEAAKVLLAHHNIPTAGLDNRTLLMRFRELDRFV